MALPGQPPDTLPPDLLQFGCPACGGELSIPAAMAGVEGPCPLCQEQIAAPVPSHNLEARRVSEMSVPPSRDTPRDEAPGAYPDDLSDTEAAEIHVHCQACGCELAIEPALAHLPGGPCPACQTWIDIRGQIGEPQEQRPWPPVPAQAPSSPGDKPPPSALPRVEEVPSPPKDERGPIPASPVDTPPLERSVRSSQGTTPPIARREVADDRPSSDPPPPKRELDGSHGEALSSRRLGPSPALDGQFRRLETQSLPPEDSAPPGMEKRRVKKRKRRRGLPDECYVGHAAGERDPRGLETSTRKRSRLFPGRKRRRSASESDTLPEECGDPFLIRCLPVLFGVILPLLGGLLAALHFEFIDPAELRFWEPRASQEGAYHRQALASTADPLAESIGRTAEKMNGRAKQSYQAVEGTIEGFLEAPLWESAKDFLSPVHLSDDSEALAFLKMFPRETFLGAEVRVIDFARMPGTDRFIFTTHVSKGLDDVGNPILTFMVVEETAPGVASIHALQFYQSWKRTLTEFLETSGAPGGRFYGAIRRAAGRPALTFPEEGPYVKLELQDLLVERPWVKEIYVREGSWAGTRLLTTLTEAWSQAVLDLEWRQGPTGDVFIEVAGVQPSLWGDFPP